MRMMLWGWIVAVFLVLSIRADASPTNLISPEITLQFTYSPGFVDMRDEVYKKFSDSSGGFGWAGLGLGAAVRLGDYFFITPQVSAMFNFVDVKVIGKRDSSSESYANFLILPGLNAKCVFPGKKVRFYLAGEGTYVSPSTGSDNLEYESGGVGGGAFAGLQVVKHAIVEIGYTYLPVKVKKIGTSTMLESPSKDLYNFGGVAIRAGYRF